MFVPVSKRVAALAIMLAVGGCAAQVESVPTPVSDDVRATPTTEGQDDNRTEVVIPTQKAGTSSDKPKLPDKIADDEKTVSSAGCEGISDAILAKFYGVVKCVQLQEAVKKFAAQGVPPESIETRLHYMYIELCMDPSLPDVQAPLPDADASSPPAVPMPMPHDDDAAVDSRDFKKLVFEYVDTCKQ